MINPTELLFRFEPASVFHLWNPHTVVHPPVPLASHFSVDDCTVLGYEIPRNSRVLVNLWAIGRNPKSWGKDAQSFNDQRFLEAEAGSTHKSHETFDWLPFGVGRRGCPGQQLGTLVTEFSVAQLVHCFNWRLSLNGQELDMIETFNGLTLPRAHELLALPTPRLGRQYNRDLSNYKTILGDRVIRSGKVFQ